MAGSCRRLLHGRCACGVSGMCERPSRLRDSYNKMSSGYRLILLLLVMMTGLFMRLGGVGADVAGLVLLFYAWINDELLNSERKFALRRATASQASGATPRRPTHKARRGSRRARCASLFSTGGTGFKPLASFDGDSTPRPPIVGSRC